MTQVTQTKKKAPPVKTKEDEKETFRFNEKELRLFEATMMIQSESGSTHLMRRFVKKMCRQYGADRVWSENGNVYAIKGQADVYPCIVAHTDTVHPMEQPGDFKLTHDTDRLEWWSYNPNKTEAIKDGGEQFVQVGIGGDDKVGIYVALNMMRNEKVLKCAFFRDEEVGCRGSREADMSFFDDVTLVLQCDRRGTNEFVNRISGELMSIDFERAVKPILDEWGFKNVTGAPTDVGALKHKGLKVCCANIACGYYEPHGPTEYIVEHDVLKAQFLVEDIVDKLGKTVWKHTYVAPVYHHETYDGTYYKRQQEEIRLNLVRMGWTQSDMGFFYRWRGSGPDPLRPNASDLPILELVEGKVEIVSDPKALTAILPPTAPKSEPDSVALMVLATAEQAYLERLEDAIRRSHPEWTDMAVLEVLRDHYLDMAAASRSEILESTNPRSIWARLEEDDCEIDTIVIPDECPFCHSDKAFLTWDEMEEAWGCGPCGRYFIYPEPLLDIAVAI
jgi:hypothetical protein